MEERQEYRLKRFCSRNILIILGFTFIMAVIALITVALTQNKPLPENLKYGIVLDAGSSHTSLYIYSWPAEKENDTGLVHQIDECRVKGPGISAYAQKISELELSMAECMERARSVIPHTQHEETPVYLGATAGMRLLSMEDKWTANKVMNTVTKSLNKYPFDFQGARILSGKEEGIFGWVTINYLLGRFTQKLSWLNPSPHEQSLSGTLGALDLGGASTQITFERNKSSDDPSEEYTYLQLYGKGYSLFTHSFLCYGKDQALLRKLAYESKNSTGFVLDPCFHSGYKRSVDMNDFLSSPCIEKTKLSRMDTVEIRGTGNYQQCQQSIENQLFSNKSCFFTHCTLDGVYIPIVRGHFAAFSAYYYVMKFLNLTTEGLPNDVVHNIMEEYCARSWEELKKTFPDVKEKYLSEYCFSGTYIILLLNKYNFKSQKWMNVHFLNQVYGSSLGWTLGYMLNLTNMIPAEQPLSPPLPHPTYVFLMIIFSLILVTVVMTALFVFLKPSFFCKDMA